MKNRNKVVPILISRVFRNGLYAQSSADDREARNLNGRQAAGNARLQQYRLSTRVSSTNDPDSGLTPQQRIIGLVPLKTNGSGRAIATEPVLIPKTGKIGSDTRVNSDVRNNINKRYLAAVFAVLVATGCSSNEISKHLQGAAAGATQLQGVAAGVMAGAAFGSQVGGAQGVLIGALVGGFIGNQIASRLGEEDKNN